MSYLMQFVRPRLRVARVDERTRLNLPGFYGDAYVRVFVEDTTKHRKRHDPHVTLRIADCVNEIDLEFSVATAAYRENSLFKINILIAALHRFRDALAAEADLRA